MNLDNVFGRDGDCIVMLGDTDLYQPNKLNVALIL